MESEKDRGVLGPPDLFLLSYLYCLNGSVEKAETLIADDAATIKKDWFVDWLWENCKPISASIHPPTENEFHRVFRGG